MSDQTDLAAAQRDIDETPRLETVLGDFLREIRGERAHGISLRPGSRLDRDLGIDSLGRTELALRLERVFRVKLSPETVGKAETVRDLDAAIAAARPWTHSGARAERSAEALAETGAAEDAGTLTEVLAWHVARHPDRPHLTLLEDDETVLGTLTYGELDREAQRVAAGLIALAIEPGDRVALMLPTSLDFFIGFFGILKAGAVPVPIYPPARPSQLEDHLRRQAAILNNAGARVMLTVGQARGLAFLLQPDVPSLERIDTIEGIAEDPAYWTFPPPARPEDLGLIQYTSGSTGQPKGVMLSHANLINNIRLIGAATQATSQDVFVSWLPLYHDMGLIGSWLASLYHAARFYVMSPISFLVHPASWLWAIHRYRGTISASPNFGFDMCRAKIEDNDIAGLDLSSLRFVANGSEPVTAHSIRRFIERFNPYGFRRDAMGPVYGLAESTVGLTFPPLGREPLVDYVERRALTRRGEALPVSRYHPEMIEIVACGRPLPGHEIRVVDDSGRELGDRREGRLEFRGPSTTAGYFNNPAATRTLIHDGWHDSGDRAYLADGEVFITGRIKDIVIRAGRNLYPHEIEEAVADIAGVRGGGVAVFGSPDPETGTERLVVMAETQATGVERTMIENQVRDRVAMVIGEPPDIVVMAPPRSVPKTSSGKLRRSAARQLFEEGRIGEKPAGVRRQILRMTAGALVKRTFSRLGRFGRLVYAGWWWSVIGAVAGLGWLGAMVLPRLSWRWAVMRVLARAGLFLVGAGVRRSGRTELPARRAVVVANHASYIDPLVIIARLPGEPVFVAKREFARQFFAGRGLRRLEAYFVDRNETAASADDSRRLAALARRGRTVVIFPEGTLTRKTGIAGFRLGAFKIAAEAGVPVVPIVLSGTRQMLRGEQWFPRWSRLGLDVGDPIVPEGDSFAEAVRLRDAARAVILRGSGEPDLIDLASIP